jgi:hypothetical protein
MHFQSSPIVLALQLAKVQETIPVPSTASPQDMIRYTRPVGLAKGAALLRVTIRDRATNRVGTQPKALEALDEKSPLAQVTPPERQYRISA